MWQLDGRCLCAKCLIDWVEEEVTARDNELSHMRDKYDHTGRCNSCGGSGYEPESMKSGNEADWIKCPACNGHGGEKGVKGWERANGKDICTESGCSELAYWYHPQVAPLCLNHYAEHIAPDKTLCETCETSAAVEIWDGKRLCLKCKLDALNYLTVGQIYPPDILREIEATQTKISAARRDWFGEHGVKCKKCGINPVAHDGTMIDTRQLCDECYKTLDSNKPPEKSKPKLKRSDKKLANDALMEALAQHIFNAPVAAIAGRAGKIVKALKDFHLGEYELDELHSSKIAEWIPDFVRWYEGKFPGCNVPLDSAKVLGHWGTWSTERPKTKTIIEPAEPRPVDNSEILPDHNAVIEELDALTQEAAEKMSKRWE